ncbi:hypothetical protein L289_3028 [Acinetobacter gerneri DSM 14967 = CIP 107464 = MTCC 9824]|nr:hypothetical protein L289_3028 [Acinetobacter gerneri DSM 14967 = CIP 107464 = MTCC 9824]
MIFYTEDQDTKEQDTKDQAKKSIECSVKGIRLIAEILNKLIFI